MTFYGAPQQSDSYERLLEALEHGHNVPEGWLALAKKKRDRERDREALEESVAADRAEAVARGEARVEAIQAGLREELAPLLEEYETAREKVTAEYEKAHKAVARARQGYAELAGMFNGMLQVARAGWGRRELPRDPEGNVTATVYVPQVGAPLLVVDGEKVTPPRPFKA